MAKGKSNTSIKAPTLSLAQRSGVGVAPIASPETQPRETAIRNAGTGKMLHTQFKKNKSTGLNL